MYPHITFFRYDKYSYIDSFFESNKDKQLEEPFYERLRREDKFREEEIRKYEQERRMRLSFAASHTPSG